MHPGGMYRVALSDHKYELYFFALTNVLIDISFAWKVNNGKHMLWFDDD